MQKIIIIIFLLVIIGGGAFVFFGSSSEDNSNNGNSDNNTETRCEFNEMIFYYRNGCSWCQKVKDDGSIEKIEELGVKVTQVETGVGPIQHQFSGVPTFVVNETVYSGYKTFEQLKELLGCQIKEEVSPPVQVNFSGEKGESVSLVSGEITLNSAIFADGLAYYYNTELPSGKTVFFFVIKDKNGIYRAAANACQVCHDTRMGFYQQGNYMVCKTCQNKYPLEKIATEKGGCNPGPINPNLEVVGGKITIDQSSLEKVSELF